MKKSLLFFALYTILCLPVFADTYCLSVWNSDPIYSPGSTNFTWVEGTKHILQNVTVPAANGDGPKYWVGCNGYAYNSDLGTNHSKSQETYLSAMPLTEWHENTLGNCAGAIGTITIYHDSGEPNLFANFSPAGYGLCYGVDQQGAIWHALPFSLVEGDYIYETETIAVSAEMQSTMSFWVGFKTATDYVFSSTMSATQLLNARVLNGVTAGSHGRFRININARNDRNNWAVEWVPYHHIVVKSVWENGYSEVIDDQLVRHNDSYTLPSIPTHVPHYCSFGGWYLDEGCTQKIETATYTPTGDVTIYAKWVRQPLGMYQFEHSHGKSGRPFIRVNGYDMQDVHTYERTIYMAPNEAQQLYRPDYLTYFRFIRWYDYNKDGVAANLTFNNEEAKKHSLRVYDDAFGQFYNRINDQSEAATFTAPADFTAANYPNGVTIACDQSAYSDAPLRLIATTGESALTGLFWYFYEVTGASKNDATLLTADAIASMAEDSEKEIVIASPATNSEGYVLIYTGTVCNGYTNRDNTAAQLLSYAKAATTYDNGSGRFKLKKVAGGYTIRSVKNETHYLGIDGSLHTQGFRNNWTEAQKTLTITEKTGDISNYVNHNYLTTGVDPSRLAITKGDDYLVSNGGWSGFAGSTQWVHAAKAATRHEVYYLVAENKTKLTADDFAQMTTGATKTVLWSHPAALPEGYVAVCNGEGSLHGWDYSTNPDEAFVNASINWRLGGGKTQSLLFTFTKTAEGDFTVSSKPYTEGSTYYLYLDSKGQAMFTADPANAGRFQIESYGYDMSDQRMPSLSALSRYGVLLRSGDKYLSSTANVPNIGRTMPVSTSTISLQSIVTNAGANAYSSVEPTLSQRLLFHILPADRMATELTDKDAPIAATINEKHLYWAIRKDDGTGRNNFPILRQSELSTLANGDYTIQLVSPLDYNEGGYAFAKDNRSNWVSLSNRNWGSVYHLVTTSSWFTATDWNPTKLTLHKQGDDYTISYDEYHLCVSNNSTLTWSNSQPAQTFQIKAPTEEITLGEHHYDPFHAEQNYLFSLYYTNGGTTYCLYSGGRYDQTCIKVLSVGSSTKDEWLEERTILAPTGQTIYIGPSLQYTSEGATNLPYYTHTYYINNNGTPLACTTSNGTWQWQKDGADYMPASVMTGRFAQINPEPTAGVHTYTLTFIPRNGNTRYNVFRARVDYRDKAAIGPSSALGYDAVANAQKIGEETFNYNMPGTTAYTAYSEPVPFNESSYGFYYGTNDHYSKGSGEGTIRTFPYWGEYGIVNTTNKVAWGIGYDIANHDETNSLTGSDASRGYMLYTDGSEIPGDLFSLQVQDLNLCAGSKMYCSAWVASVTDDNSTPVNLDFEVTAISNEGKQSVLTSYTTGDIRNSGVSHWQHIVFPVTYSAEFGDITNVREFRVRIINKGKNAAGNDFAIDDISFCAKKPAVLPVQASATSCIAGGSTETIPTYLRIDYEQLVAEEGNVEYFYRWYDAAYHTKAADYYGETDNKNYGQVMLQKVPDEQAANVFQDYKTFDIYINTDNHGATAGVYYVKEQAEDGQTRYFLYVVQPLEITANKTYRVAVAAHPDDLTSPQTNSCAILESINMIGGARIRVDGNVATDAITPCGNQLYTLDVEMAYLLHNEATGTYDEHSYLCSADWLLGDSAYINLLYRNSDPTYNADYDAIEAAILAYRTEEAKEDQVTLINHLVQEGLLTINQPRITTYPNANTAVSTLHYTAFPRPEASGSHTPAVCETPQVVSFHLPDDAQRNGIALGQETKLPNIISANPRNVRMTKGTEEVSIPIRVLGTLKGYVLTHAQLYTTNNEGEKVHGDIIPIRLTDMGNNEVPAVMGNCKVTLYGDVLKSLTVGRYSIYLEMTIPEKDEQGNDVSDCEVTYAYFTLIVQPKQLTWQPGNTTGGANPGAWNNDANWQEGIAPIASSQVVMPATALTVPAATIDIYDEDHRTATQSVSVESGAQDYITYEIGYTPFACKDIYLPVGASLYPQTTLSIGGQAYIDMPFAPKQWQLTSFPIQGVVSGDIFIPEHESSEPFSIAPMETPADRYLHPFYQNLYNASVTNRTGSGSCEETVTCSTWLTNTTEAGQQSGNTANGTTLPYGYADGAYNACAIWLDQATDGVVRLPKAADVTYRFYDKNTLEWIGYLSDDIHRSDNANYGRPAYSASGQTFTLRGNSASNVFLFGNPTFAYIDMKEFLTVNSNVLTGTVHRYDGTNNQYIAYHGIGADGSHHCYLPPCSAVLVESKTEDTEVEVTLTDAMLAAAPAAPARASHQSSIINNQSSTIFITAQSGAFTTYAMAEERGGSNFYDEEEDADVFLMAPEQTPFAIYTTADNHALAINRHANLDYLPLCLYSIEPAMQGLKQTTYLTFSGDNDYLSEWDLVMLGTTKQAALKDGLKVKLGLATDGTPNLALRHTRKREVTTDLWSAETNTEVRKMLIDGQIYILRAGQLYDVRGQLVQTWNTTMKGGAE